MKEEEEQRVSVRAYARMLGISDTAVLKAYKAGKIPEGIIYPEGGGRPYVLPVKASKAWGKNLNPDSGNNIHLIENIENANKGNELNIKPKAKPSTPQVPISEADLNTTPEADETITSLTEAKRVEAVYKAKLLRLEYLEKEKELISYRDVNKQLAEMGIKIREALESLPNKLVDNIIAQQGRNESVIVFNKAIKELLTKIAVNDLSLK